jgi:hypothetical protein
MVRPCARKIGRGDLYKAIAWQKEYTPIGRAQQTLLLAAIWQEGGA